MKRKVFMFAALVCCMLVSLSVSAGETISYKKCGDCELIVKRTTNLIGRSWTTYGLSRNGVSLVSPECDVLTYNEDLHIVVFRDLASALSAQYHIYLYNTDTGKCVYSGRFFAQKIDVRVPWLSFEKNGKYVDAVVHYYSLNFGDRRGDAKKTIGSYFTKDGRLYQVATKQVAYEAPVE